MHVFVALLVHYVCDGWRNDCGRGRGKEHSGRQAKFIFVQLTLTSNASLMGRGEAQAGGHGIGKLDFFPCSSIDLDCQDLFPNSQHFIPGHTAEKKGRFQSAPGCSLSLRRVIPFIKQFMRLFHCLVPYHISRATKIAGDVKGFETLDGKSCFCHKWPTPEPAMPGTSCQYHLCHSLAITISSR